MDEHAYPGIWLTTLDALKRHRGINANTTPQDGARTSEETDALLSDMIVDASASIIDELARLPLPHIETMQYPAVFSHSLYVPDDLLEAITVTDPDGAVVDPLDFTLSPPNRYPKFGLMRSWDSAHPFWTSLDGLHTGDVVTLTGIFGYVPHWQRAWRDSGQVLPAGGLPDDDDPVTITLANVNAFEVGGYGRIGSEYVQFTAVAPDEDTAPEGDVTIRRALLGTSAASHDAGIAIELFVHHSDIQSKCTEWAAYLYKTLDRLGEQLQVYDGNVQVVNGLSPLIRRALRKHKRY